MKILTLTNLYPPHHAGTFEFHCQKVVESLRLRGHEILVLTSTHGMRNEQRDGDVVRRLTLNGVHGAAEVISYLDLKELELHNNQCLLDAIREFEPDIIHVFSLNGLSKSLIFTLRNSKLPVVYDVFDHWMSADLAEDPWLRFWNAPSLPFLEQSKRKALEVSGERNRLDNSAPTRMTRGYDRLPLFGTAKERATIKPNSLMGFQFERLYFCSLALKTLTEQVGFCISHADIIHPCFPTQAFFGEIKSCSAPMTKLLVATRLTAESGVMTALQALKTLCEAKVNVTLSIYGRGDSSYIADLRSFSVTNQLPVSFLTVSNAEQDLPKVYRSHDVLLHTPEWAEPFPTTPLEAMACGVPVIGAAVGGADELLRHGENALTYVPGDFMQLAQRIQELQFSPALRVQMAETAQAEVLAKFNEAAVTDQIENYLSVSQETWVHSA